MRKLLILVSVFAMAMATSCANSQEAARAGLARRNIAYTVGEFVQRAGQGDLAVVHLFLISGMSPNARDEKGRVALVEAVRAGQTDMVRVLLLKGADANMSDEEGNSPLMVATTNGRTHIAKLLINAGADTGGSEKVRRP